MSIAVMAASITDCTAALASENSCIEFQAKERITAPTRPAPSSKKVGTTVIKKPVVGLAVGASRKQLMVLLKFIFLRH